VVLQAYLDPCTHLSRLAYKSLFFVKRLCDESFCMR
jgi:hypothetical protein